MRLVKAGVPWADAWAMSRARRWALIVVAGELDGAEFDWGARRWREPKG